jgi:predicted negative regulator of RcsB-dependent stress response
MTLEDLKLFIRENKKGLIVGAVTALVIRALIR